MPGLRFVNPAPQFRDLRDDIAVGGRLYFYTSGTLTLEATYSDSDLTIPNANPIQLDAFGRSATSIFLDPTKTYRCVLKDADLQVIWDRDPLSGSDIAAAIAEHNEDPDAHFDATETQRGMVELANTLEAIEGEATDKAMTPANVRSVLDAMPDLTMDGPLNEAQGDDIASQATVDLDTATGNLIDITGTTTITTIVLSQGRERVVRFTGALTLTHGANLVLPGAANIVTAAGDFAVFRGYAGGVVRCSHYQRAVGFNGTLANVALTEGSVAIPGTPIIVKWGARESTVDGDQDFLYPVAFPNFCWGVFVQRLTQGADDNALFPALSPPPTKEKFTINREDANDDTLYFYYLAIGS